MNVNTTQYVDSMEYFYDSSERMSKVVLRTGGVNPRTHCMFFETTGLGNDLSIFAEALEGFAKILRIQETYYCEDQDTWEDVEHHYSEVMQQRHQAYWDVYAVEQDGPVTIALNRNGKFDLTVYVNISGVSKSDESRKEYAKRVCSQLNRGNLFYE